LETRAGCSDCSSQRKLDREAHDEFASKEWAKTELGSPRDFFGYGPYPPHPCWPGDARIAINFNLNFEAGGERSLLEGDDQKTY
jgi:hypothetical protein